MTGDARGTAFVETTRTRGVAASARDLASERGTVDRGIGRQPSSVNVPVRGVDGHQRKAAFGLDAEEMEGLRQRLHQTSGALPPPIRFGLNGWARLLRYLLTGGAIEDAAELFSRAGDEARDWAIQTLDRLWPVGLGIAVDASLGATFGVPLQLTGGLKLEFVRSSATRFRLKREGILDGGFDTGIGAGAYIGIGTTGLGRSVARQTAGQGIGATAGAQVQASLVIEVKEEFEFPVLEDPGFLPLLVYLVDVEDEIRLAALLHESLEGLLPDPFRKRLELRVAVSARGRAGAEAGVRTRGTQTNRRVVDPVTKQRRRKPVHRFDFDRGTGKTEDSRREFIVLDEQRKGWKKAFNLRALVQSTLRASLSSALRLEVGGGLAIAPTFNRDSRGRYDLTNVSLQLFAEGRSAVSLAAALPVLGGLLPNLDLDATAGLRVALAVKPPFGVGDVTLVGHEIYVQSGDMDAEELPAHEVAMQLPGLDPSAYSDLAAFAQAIKASRMVHRVGLGTAIGRNYTIVLSRFKEFTALLSPNYREWGFLVVGMITFEFRVPGQVMRQMVSQVSEFLLAGLQADPNVQALVKQANAALGSGAELPALTETAAAAAHSIFTQAIQVLSEFWRSGVLPPKLEALVTTLLRTMIDGLQRIDFRGELGVGAAGEVQAADGAKVRLNAAGSARVVYERDILALVRQEMPKLLEPQQLLDLLRSALDEASTHLRVPPHDIERAPR